MGEDMFVMRHIGKHELAHGVHMDVIKAYNKMHANLTSHSILKFGLRFKAYSYVRVIGLRFRVRFKVHV
jgi:hypothetical protein